VLLTVVGYTHASNVIALVNCSDGALLTVTEALVPLKLKALPYLPEVVHVAPLIVPLFPLPDRSVNTVPLPSLNPYAAIRLGVGVEVGVGVGVAVPGFTVTRKLMLVLLGPSFTVTVMVALPVCPAAGVIVTLRLAPPLPPNTIFPAGTSPGLDDTALNCRFAAATSASPTVNAMGPVEVS
jgi:hypothetical protein